MNLSNGDVKMCVLRPQAMNQTTEDNDFSTEGMKLYKRNEVI